MRLRRKKSIYKTGSLVHILFEQEEEAEDLFDEEEEEAPADEEAPATDAPAGEEGEEGEEEKELEVDVEDEVKLSKSIDQDLEALLIDFETDARKSRQITDEFQVEESLHLGMLVEQEDYEEDIDLDRFAAEVARLVKNYTTLLDMEKMLVSKAREFIVSRYGEDAESDLVDILSTQHDIDIQLPESPKAGKEATPIAIGAGAGGAGGGGAV
jgi:hypothetical protein